MKRLMVAVCVVPLCVLLLVGCGKTAHTPPAQNPNGLQGGAASACQNGQVEMAQSTFVQSTCTIKAGGTVTFIDPTATGNVHILCFGTGTKCVPNPNGPAQLNTPSGVQFTPGQAPAKYIFRTPGTYNVICTIHPGMHVTITVQ